jgi:DNA-directed RNA polymerase specialized sigma24 family protein
LAFLLELIAPANGIRNRNRAKASKLERMSESDEKLLGRMRGGDEEAFTTLYRRRQGPVYRFALHMTGSAAIAEDVTQEVFLALIEKGRRFDGSRGPLLSFLYGIARNRVLRRIEKERVAVRVGEEYAGGEDLLNDLTRRETVEHVRRAVRGAEPA